MRDPKRIPELLRELEIFWTRSSHVDTRLGQLVVTLSWAVSNDEDPFYLEDERLLEFLKIANSKGEDRGDSIQG